MATIEVLGIPHAYELTASTSSHLTLVFIHGWLNSRGYWQPVISRLSDDFQCLSYDLRGFGESQSQFKTEFSQNTVDYTINSSYGGMVANPFSSDYTPATYAHDLKALLQKLNILN